jgi:dihydroceramide fatty acyl 2-hydroxylase
LAAPGRVPFRAPEGDRRATAPGFLPFGAAFLAGYLAYDVLHYHVHHHRPKTALGKRLRELHMRHHFQNHERGYGVSAPFWDHVFGTAPKKTQ